MTKFAFLAGLPRTGSTVLSALLSSHPDVHSTNTSCVFNLLQYVRGFSVGETPYFQLKDPDSPVWGIMRGVLYGAYEKVDKKLVIEKSRSWAGEVDLLQKLTGESVKILAPVRPVPEIISSFILVSQKSKQHTKIEEEILSAQRPVNVWSLSRVIWEKYIYSSWKTFKVGFESNPDSFLLLPYSQTVDQPKETASAICSFLDLASWEMPTSDIVNSDPENDAIYGIPGLHEVRPKLERTSPPAWEVLGDECYEFWASKNLEFWRGKTI